MSTPQLAARRPSIRPSFRTALQVGFLLMLGVFWYFQRNFTGGQIAASPDKKFVIGVDRTLNPLPGDRYRIRLQDYASGQLLREFSIIPVQKHPQQQLRGGPRVIHWDESSQFADIILDGQHFCRISVPNTLHPPNSAP